MTQLSSRRLLAVTIALLAVSVGLGVMAYGADLLDPIEDASVDRVNPGDRDAERSPGVTVAKVAINRTPYEMTDTGNRSLVEPGSFQVDRENRTIETSGSVDTEEANGAVLLEAAYGTRLVVTDGEYLGLELAPDDASTERVSFYLMDVRTEVLDDTGACQLSVTHEGEHGSGPLYLLYDAGATTELAVGAKGPCEQGTIRVTHLGTDWSWA